MRTFRTSFFITAFVAVLVYGLLSRKTDPPSPSETLEAKENSGSPVDELLYKLQDEDSLKKANKQTFPAGFPVGIENYEKLVSFIEKHGFVVKEKGIPCDHQYTFVDNLDVRHAFITIKRDAAGNPSMNGNVRQISVWGYKDGIKDQEHSFGYVITAERVSPLTMHNNVWTDSNFVKYGYSAFLREVLKEK